MIRGMLIFFFLEKGVGGAKRGLALRDVTLAARASWHGRSWRKRRSICWGSCSICLLMSTVVGGTHVCHVTRRAGSTFTWRSDHRGKWQPLWQMFSQSWGRSHGRAVQSEGPGYIARQQLLQHVSAACTGKQGVSSLLSNDMEMTKISSIEDKQKLILTMTETRTVFLPV